MSERAFVLIMVGRKRTMECTWGNSVKVLYALLQAVARAMLKAEKPGVTPEELADMCRTVLLEMMQDMQEGQA